MATVVDHRLERMRADAYGAIPSAARRSVSGISAVGDPCPLHFVTQLRERRPTTAANMPLEPGSGSIFGGKIRARSSLESIAGRGVAAASYTAIPVTAPAPLEVCAPVVPHPAPSPPARGAPLLSPAVAADAVDERLIEILDAPLAMGETAASGFLRKEQAIVAVLATLTVLESRALLARIRTARAGDRLVEKLGRLTAERRGRLLAFLADARRREALQLARTRR